MLFTTKLLSCHKIVLTLQHTHTFAFYILRLKLIIHLTTNPLLFLLLRTVFTRIYYIICTQNKRRLCNITIIHRRLLTRLPLRQLSMLPRIHWLHWIPSRSIHPLLIRYIRHIHNLFTTDLLLHFIFFRTIYITHIQIIPHIWNFMKIRNIIRRFRNSSVNIINFVSFI